MQHCSVLLMVTKIWKDYAASSYIQNEATGSSEMMTTTYYSTQCHNCRQDTLNYLGRGEFFKPYFPHKHILKYRLMTNARAHKIADRKQRNSHVMLSAFIILILTSEAWVQSHASSTTHLTWYEKMLLQQVVHISTTVVPCHLFPEMSQDTGLISRQLPIWHTARNKIWLFHCLQKECVLIQCSCNISL